MLSVIFRSLVRLSTNSSSVWTFASGKAARDRSTPSGDKAWTNVYALPGRGKPASNRACEISTSPSSGSAPEVS
jgi:hypothetical protein